MKEVIWVIEGLTALAMVIALVVTYWLMTAKKPICPKCGTELKFDSYSHYECSKCGYREKVYGK
jgi:tRNA(Ile2) C34 agmatinyltransferase TiaS